MLIATRSGKINISKEKDTKLVAERLCKFINLGDFILLTGNLGVGKTTFIKYIINSLQRINKQEISEVPSPTFNIVNEYKINEIIINHYDLFKLKDPKEIHNIGLFENNLDVVTLIEWPEIISKKPKNIIELYFSYEDDFKKRKLEIFSENRKEMINEFK